MSRRSLEEFATRKLESLERRHLVRRLEADERTAPGVVVRDGAELVSFACNDYLGLTRHPAVVAAVRDALERFGAGAGAARLITGNHPLYRDVEARLAALKGTEDAVVFGSGYLTNVGVIPLLTGPQDLILVDELAHSCILVGSDLSRASVTRFAHNDVAAVAATLAEVRGSHRHCLIVTDGVFSMEGDLAPLPALADLAEAHDAWLMTDDAHGLGVVGGGRGSTFAHGVPVDVPLQMGTLSKAVGVYGGYLCASRAVSELVRNRAKSFVYSTGLPPATVACAAKALELIATDAALVAAPLERARRFTSALGLPAAESAIVSVVIGGAEQALDAAERLGAAGFLVAAIRPPTVPPGTSRLRFAFSAAHSQVQVDALADAVERLGIVA